MAESYNLVGQQFGRLRVISQGGKNSCEKRVWICKCNCGSITQKTTQYLCDARNKYRNCGCVDGRTSPGSALDLTGQEFGRLKIVSFVKIHTTPGGTKRRIWKCRCVCGNSVEASTLSLRGGHTQSCGCLKSEIVSKRMSTHGRTPFYLYKLWKDIKQRCLNPNSRSWKNYGKRGITICEKWKEDFPAFRNYVLENIRHRTLEKNTIDRIDNSKGYEPNNLRWASRVEQYHNRRPKSEWT